MYKSGIYIILGNYSRLESLHNGRFSLPVDVPTSIKILEIDNAPIFTYIFGGEGLENFCLSY